MPLDRLHNEFTKAIGQHSYLGPMKSNQNQLEQTNQKVIHMAQVFKLAREEIEQDLKGHNDQGKEISHLRSLHHDGRLIYERYNKATNTWSRSFLKSLAYYTPDLLKTILPSCFSNDMERAEQETFKEYTAYRDFIRDKISELAQDDREDGVEDEAGEEAAANGEDLFDPDEDAPSPQKEDKSERQASDKSTPSKPAAKPSAKPAARQPITPKDPAREKRLSELREQRLKRFGGKSGSPSMGEEDPEMQKYLMSFYSQDSQGDQPAANDTDLTADSFFEEEDDFLTEEEPASAPPVDTKAAAAPPSSPTPTPFKATPPTPNKDELEGSLRKNLHLLNEFDELPLSLQKMKAVLQRTISAIAALIKVDSEAQKSLGKLGVNDKTFNALKDPLLQDALDKNDDKKVEELLEHTPWQKSFQEAMAQKGCIKFGIRRFAGGTALMLADETGKRLSESNLQKYRGEIQVTLTDIKSLSDLEELFKFLDKNHTCCPYRIVINLKDGEKLTQPLVQLLLKLSDCVAEIKVEGPKELNFKELALTADEEYQVIQNLDSFQFSQVQNVVLSDHPKKSWKAEDFSRLLSLCPTMEFLNTCYKECASFQQIVIPSEMKKGNVLDLNQFSLDHIPHLFSQFTEATHIFLTDLPLTDVQLRAWIQQGYFTHVHALHLKGCKLLTTDILPALAKLPQLTTLTLPDLPEGTLSLDKLPKFENPLKIKLLYTTSQVTQILASSLYTGPQHLAALFQIPLARQRVGKVFAPNHKRLDPKSVTYWLHNDEYKKLKPQMSIWTILADSNSELTDENLVEFVQKFPETRSISLYNCPNVTDVGIMKLVKACPKITSIDLMGCPHISESLYLGDGNLDILSAQLQQIIITDTGFSIDCAKLFQEQMGFKKKINPTDKDEFKVKFEETTLKITDDDLTDEDDALEKLLKKTKNLNTLKRINLEDCTKLTNAMLGQLLDHLNAPAKIETTNDGVIDNPERLNIAVLNLKGCAQITEEAFHQPPKPASESESDKEDDQASVKTKIEPKVLGNLDRVVMGGTKIPVVLQQVYPQVTFQESEEPITIQIDPEIQLAECMAYHHLNDQANLDDLEERELRRLTANYLHNRIVVELFGKDIDGAEEVLERPVATELEEFRDISLTFKTLDSAAKPIVFHAHRDVLYVQSLYFVNGFRPGGMMSKESGLIFENDHATPEAAQAVMDLLYGKPCMDQLKWDTAAHVAELIGPHIFNLPGYYKTLLAHIHKHFDISRAEKMFMVAHLLEDKEGIKKYEELLLAHLDKLNDNDKDRRTFRTIAKIAREYEGLQELKDKVTKIEGDQNRKLIKKELEDQAKETEATDRLVAEALEEEEEEQAQAQAQKSAFLWNVFFGGGLRTGRRRNNRGGP